MKSPFKFLDSYTKNDREIFFGREKEIEELYHRVFENKIMLVYGVSGTGKSSLIHCGLANKFSETDWLPLVIRRGANLPDSLVAAIKASSVTQFHGEIVTPVQFTKSVKSLYLDNYKPIYFIFDQFEELFIFGSREEKKTVVQVLKALIDSDIQCRFIFVMREEYMASITEFEKYIPTIFSNRVRIEKMAYNNALEAIKGPCRVANITIEDGFAETLLERLSPESADIELTYLQVFLDKVFRLSQSEKTGNQDHLSFTLSLLQKTGNVSDLLGSFLDEQIALLDNPESGLAVLKSFVSAKGTKKQMSLKEVSEYLKTLGKPFYDSVIQKMLLSFINLRILRDKDQNGKYELRHDTLATKIYDKISGVEKEILEIRQFLENSYASWQRRGVYLSADDLNYIAPYKNRLHLTRELSGFVYESIKDINRVKRRRRNFSVAATILLLVSFAGFTLWALKEKRKADDAGLRQLESILKLNKSFEKVKRNQVQRKNEIYQQFQMSYATSPAKMQSLWDKAEKIRAASDELTDFIYQLEYKMISKTEKISLDSAKKVNLSAIKNKSGTSTPNQVLFGKNDNTLISNVFLLKRKIRNYRTTIFDQIGKKDWDKINFSIDIEKSALSQKGDSATWENANFNNAIVAGAITNLNNLITEINYIEIDAINLIYSWGTASSFSFDVIRPLVIPISNYLLQGEDYEAKLQLSAYSSKANMEAYIFKGKDNLSESDMLKSAIMVPLISKKGTIDIKIPADSVGANKYCGFISVRGPDENLKFGFSASYLVGNPTIVISPTGGNVLYRGIDNLINVSVPGISSDRIKYKITNGVLARNKNGEFILRAGEGKETVFNMEVEINKGSHTFDPMHFRLIDVPNPVVSIGEIKGGNISVQDILSTAGLNVKLKEFFVEVNYAIAGFTVMILDSSGRFTEERAKGSAFTEKQKILFSKLKPGDYLFIKGITVLGPENKMRNLGDLIYKII